MAANPLPKDAKPIPWGKRYRNPLMNAAFWAFWIGFPLAYLGGVQKSDGLVGVSFILFILACLVPLVTKK